MKRAILILLGLLVENVVHSQEYLIDVSGVKNSEARITESSIEKQTLTLPIFDDFSKQSDKPDSQIWENEGGVYINYTYPIGPPTVGVATFDAADNRGFIYKHLNSTPKKADSLTTKQFQLNKEKKDSTFVTFYYQPQGNGNAPEESDSLVLKVIANNYEKVIWKRAGCTYESFNNDSINNTDPDLNFKLVHINLSDTNFYKTPIKLKFVNYVSITSGSVSQKINSDHWNLDYFYVRENVSKEDTVFKEIAFTQPFDFFMNKYSSVPWGHYPNAIENELRASDSYIRNLWSSDLSITKVSLLVENLRTHKTQSFSGGGGELYNISANSMKEETYWVSNIAPVNYDGDKNAQFKFEASILYNEQGDHQENNKVVRYFNFANYYSRDDGSAEKAYGFNQRGVQIAYQYKTYKADWLNGISFHFDKIQDSSIVEKNFKLCVWLPGTGNKPGELIRLEKPNDDIDAFTYDKNGFVTVALNEPLWVEGDFFIGWEQISDESLNVGFDVNTRSSNPRLFFKIYNDWYESDYNNVGSLMMRPIFGDINNVSVNKNINKKTIELYPNPSSGELFINTNNSNVSTIEVYNSLGKKVWHQQGNSSLNLINQANGIYFVKVILQDASFEVHKIILSK